MVLLPCTNIGGSLAHVEPSCAEFRYEPPSSRCRWQAYWIYWGVLFATPLTWVLALAATVNIEWITYDQNLTSFGGFGTGEDWFCDADHKAYMIYYVSYTELHTVDEMCSACESILRHFRVRHHPCFPKPIFFEMCSYPGSAWPARTYKRQKEGCTRLVRQCLLIFPEYWAPYAAFVRIFLAELRVGLVIPPTRNLYPGHRGTTRKETRDTSAPQSSLFRVYTFFFCSTDRSTCSPLPSLPPPPPT